MIHSSIRDGEDILECGQCGKRSWIVRGSEKVVCPHCNHVERMPKAEAPAAPKTSTKPETAHRFTGAARRGTKA